ncbi:hypothetical protein EZV62_006571 [Acer yangbiense]|uniref:Uncharacterized protein n=1 Tax=Acer yangbiense TaxID=1000413 RepID=A0A5C7IA78_9ROSI|nr:hypothetical protein EZV62_006571 [Acer yangbiense]
MDTNEESLETNGPEAQEMEEALAQTSLLPDIDLDSDKKHQRFNIWKHSYVKACAIVDQELQQYRKIAEQLH